MPGQAEVSVSWHGDRIRERFWRAVARGTISIGEQIAARAKRGVHVVSGHLERSIHSAKPDSQGEQRATQSNVLRSPGAVVETGSWLDYACVEEARGGSHAYMMPAVQAVRGTSYATFKAAFVAEGLE